MEKAELLYEGSCNGCMVTWNILTPTSLSTPSLQALALGPPLQEAASAGNTSKVSELLAKNADIHLRDENGNTALTMAACEGHAEIVSLLADRGADVESRDSYDTTG